MQSQPCSFVMAVSFLLTLQPSSAHPRSSSHLLNVHLVMVLASASETAEKVAAVCLFHKHISIKSFLAMS